jgi:two-component system sensor histidine kinase PilS (NtrC family)
LTTPHDRPLRDPDAAPVVGPVVAPVLGATSLLPPAVIESVADERRTVTRMQLFMGTRLGVATLLLGGTLLIALEDQRGFDAFTPQFLVALIAAIYAASLVSAVWLLGSRNRERVALAQVATDLIITAGLVYVTGGAASGFTFLFGVAVLMAAMVVGPTAARVTGASAIMLYGSLVLCLHRGWIAPPADQPLDTYRLPLSELAYAGLLNMLGLLLVTMLASNLSARLIAAGGQLRLAEASAASLARLNDDIVRSLSAGLLSTDLEGRVRTLNPTAVEMLGGPAATLMGRDIAEILDVDVRPLLGPPRGIHVPVARAESTACRTDGTRFPIGYSINRLEHVDGTAIGALVLFQDLSEVTRLREIATIQERLAVLGRLSAGLAHEIRNPLGSISGSVELVRESPNLDEEERRLLGIILDEVDRLDDLVSTMLQVGRPRPPARRGVDLRELLTAVVEMSRRGLAAAKHVTIECSVPEHPVHAWIDGDQVRQVLWNLIKNALQASPDGSTVRVRTATTVDGGAMLEVADEGRGLDRSQMDKVYTMFYSERTHGAGIGLALVRQIVDAHGGAIDIRSEQHRGATFVVTFPPRAHSSERGVSLRPSDLATPTEPPSA